MNWTGDDRKLAREAKINLGDPPQVERRAVDQNVAAVEGATELPAEHAWVLTSTALLHLLDARTAAEACATERLKKVTDLEDELVEEKLTSGAWRAIAVAGWLLVVALVGARYL